MAWVKERHGARGTTYTGCYRDPDGRERSAGSFPSRREALRAAHREEQRVLSGSWHDASQGEVTFFDYVEKEWLPHKHLEVTTRASYVSYLNKQFYPAFGKNKLNKISPMVIQDWIAGLAMQDYVNRQFIQEFEEENNLANSYLGIIKKTFQGYLDRGTLEVSLSQVKNAAAQLSISLKGL